MDGECGQPIVNGDILSAVEQPRSLARLLALAAQAGTTTACRQLVVAAGAELPWRSCVHTVTLCRRPLWSSKKFPLDFTAGIFKALLLPPAMDFRALGVGYAATREKNR